GLPARRAVTRWAWRLLRREWRQQLLILGLIAVAVAAPPLVSVSRRTRHCRRTWVSVTPRIWRRFRITARRRRRRSRRGINVTVRSTSSTTKRSRCRGPLTHLIFAHR